jgi:pimeloyl-ACP methyl ester carboxylesterase
MATFVLVHGASSTSWYWHRVVPLLAERGHEAVAVDLPVDDDSASLTQYADAIVESTGSRTGVVLVAQSMAGFSAPMACERTSVALLVLLNAMVPKPGESAGEWWANTGQPQAMLEHAAQLGREAASPDELMNDPEWLFLHDLPPDVAAESVNHIKNQSGTPFGRPWPLDKWPDLATRALVGRDDRLFPLEFQRRVLRERLGIEPDVIDGGHLLALSRPEEVAGRLDVYGGESS